MNPQLPRPDRPVLDVVVPVLDEAHVLERQIHRLRAVLEPLPFTWRITIADNGSTDGTGALAVRLADELPGLRVVQLRVKGRGRALREAWSTSDAFVLAYTDVDLSTGLTALLPMIAPLISGHASMATGSRLIRGSHVERGPKREFISRSYNTLLRVVLGARFRDAQCGFKAIRADAGTFPPPGGRRRGLVLRHRAPRARSAARSADRRGPRRLDRRSRLPRRHPRDRARRPRRCRATGEGARLPPLFPPPPSTHAVAHPRVRSRGMTDRVRARPDSSRQPCTRERNIHGTHQRRRACPHHCRCAARRVTREQTGRGSGRRRPGSRPVSAQSRSRRSRPSV